MLINIPTLFCQFMTIIILHNKCKKKKKKNLHCWRWKYRYIRVLLNLKHLKTWCWRFKGTSRPATDVLSIQSIHNSMNQQHSFVVAFPTVSLSFMRALQMIHSMLIPTAPSPRAFLHIPFKNYIFIKQVWYQDFLDYPIVYLSSSCCYLSLCYQNIYLPYLVKLLDVN